MTPDESTDSVRVAAVASLIVADTDEPMWSAVVIAKHILAGDWLADVVAQAKAEALREAAKYLRRHGSARFNQHGGLDARGAGLWDAGCAIDPDDGDALGIASEATS